VVISRSFALSLLVYISGWLLIEVSVAYFDGNQSSVDGCAATAFSLCLGISLERLGMCASGEAQF
jgi:hypothetical protein